MPNNKDGDNRNGSGEGWTVPAKPRREVRGKIGPLGNEQPTMPDLRKGKRGKETANTIINLFRRRNK